MIKRLRLKFLCVSMALVTALLVAILGMICYFTQNQLENSSIAALQASAMDYPGPGNGPGDPMKGSLRPQSQPCFVLAQDPRGGLSAFGSNYYDLTDQALLQEIFRAAQESGAATGILEEYALRFYRLEGGPGVRYAFTDISAEIETMQDLVISCAGIGIAAFVLLFVVFWLLSKWMVRPVEEAWNRQRQFIADASHELKTPLTVILTNAELLQSEDFDQAAKERFAGSIQSMSNQMRGLVEGLLDLARIDNSGIRQQMATLSLSQLAEETTLPFEAVYFEAERTLQTQIEPGLCVYGSASHLRQVLEILLDNGQKYSLPGSTVTLKLARSGHRAVLSVASQGESLTAQQCKDIFKRFYRVDEARKMNHSYGLGLPIAQSIVAEHKGRIWCESKDGINTFFVSLSLHN